MPQTEGGLKGLYYGITDKSWAFAEWLEAKGLPLASFCEKHHINPLVIISIIILGILLLIVFAMGAIGGVSYGSLTVTVTSAGSPIEGATVSYTYGNQDVSNVTNAQGKATIKFPKGVPVTISASKSAYATNSTSKTLNDDSGTASISIKRKVGTLKVNVNVAGGRALPSGSYVVANSPNLYSNTKPPVNGVATFDDIPAGANVLAYVSIGSQKIPPAGEQATVQDGKVSEITINVPESAMSIGLTVNVQDSLYQDVDGASVQLFNWDTGAPVGDSQLTYGGTATMNGITLGTSVYATVSPPPNSGYSSYNGRTANQKIDVTREGISYSITLDIVGRVTVCINDDTGAPLMTGNLRLLGTDGRVYATRTISKACEDFSGLPEGISIFPEVNAPTYITNANRASARTIDYSTVTQFTVNMQKLAAGDSVAIYVHVSDCNGDPIRGIDVKIIDAEDYAILAETSTECSGSASFSIPADVIIPQCGNAATTVANGRAIYAVAFDEDYQLGRSQVVTAAPNTVLDITICEADEDNAGNLDVCVYKDGAAFNGADLELYNDDGDLLWTANTEDDEDDRDNCFTFMNIPDGTVVYAKAVNIGSDPEVSGTATIVGGETANLTIYKGSMPVVLDTGTVQVCVKDYSTNTTLSANVSLYDNTTDTVIVAGQTSSGCVTFNNVVAETNSGGQITARKIYVKANASGYAVYSGKTEGAILAMVPNGQLNVNLYLREAFEICVQLRLSDTSGVANGDVSLYYNSTATTPVETKTADISGTAKFYQAQKDTYYFKVSEAYTLYAPLSEYTFPKANVSNGNCGIIYLYDLGSLCNLGLEVLNSGVTISAIAGEPAQVPIRILVGGERGDSSISNEGSTNTKHKVQLNDGNEVNATFQLDGDYQSFVLGYGSTTYSSDSEIIAKVTVSDVGLYTGTISVVENAQCSAQAQFDLDVYEEQLLVSVDSVSLDPSVDTSESFCIYATDENGDNVDNAQVMVYVDEIDGWGQTSSATATYDDSRQCYRGTIAASMVAKDTSGDYKSGTFDFRVVAKRNNITTTVITSAVISATELCGNGVKDSGETCDSSATNDTGCDDDEVCKSDCSACEAEDCGSLSLSADSATLTIGSGTSTGFCVYVTDDCGTVTGATATAKFLGSGGWPKDTTLTASYDTTQSCYYFAVSESMAYSRTMSGSELTGSKTVTVGATLDDESASGTTTVNIECGCDEERWCEASCICDEDCEEGGGGSINLAGCLQLAAANGYTPTGYSGYNNYGYSGYGSTRRGYPTGGTYPSGNYGGSGMNVGSGAVGLSGAGGSYLGFDWNACKQLFGWGDEGGSGVKSYVLVNDYLGLIDNAGPNKGNCQLLINQLKESGGFTYVYVDNKNAATDYCCTDNFEKFWGTACDWDDMKHIIDSQLQNNQVTYIDIIGPTTASMSQPAVSDKFKVFQGQKDDGSKGFVMYYNDRLYTGAAAFATSEVKLTSGPSAQPSGGASPRTTTTKQTSSKRTQWIWGVLDQVPFEVASEVWFSISQGTKVDYPSDVLPEQKNIILATDYAAAKTSGLKGVYLTGSETDKRNEGLSASWFSDSPNSGTSTYVITNYDQLTTGSGVLVDAAKTLAGDDYPKFEDVPKEELSGCENGDYKSLTNTLMLRANNDFYVVGTSGTPKEICKETSSKITLNQGSTDIAKIAYAKVKNEVRYLFVAGKADYLSTLLPLTNTQKWPKSSASKIYSIDGTKYGLVPFKCNTAKQKCTLTGTTQDAMDASIVSGLSKSGLPENVVLKDKLLDCICHAGAGDAKAITGTIDFSAFKQYYAMSTHDITQDLRIYVNNRLTSYQMVTSANLEASCDPSKGTCTYKILNVAADKNVMLKAGLEKTSTSDTDPYVCSSSNTVIVTVDDLKQGPVFNADTKGKLTISSQNTCLSSDTASHLYTITGKVVDANGQPVQNAMVSPYKNNQRIAIQATTNVNGEFTLQNVQGYVGGSYMIKATIKNVATGGDGPFTPGVQTIPFPGTGTSSSDPFGGPAGETVVDTPVTLKDGKNLQFSNPPVYRYTLSGNVTDCSTNKLFTTQDTLAINDVNGGLNNLFGDVGQGSRLVNGKYSGFNVYLGSNNLNDYLFRLVSNGDLYMGACTGGTAPALGASPSVVLNLYKSNGAAGNTPIGPAGVICTFQGLQLSPSECAAALPVTLSGRISCNKNNQPVDATFWDATHFKVMIINSRQGESDVTVGNSNFQGQKVLTLNGQTCGSLNLEPFAAGAKEVVATVNVKALYDGVEIASQGLTLKKK